MTTETTRHHLFVDLENVPGVDLSLLVDAGVHVTVLIGHNQKKSELEFVKDVHRLASQATLVEVGASGRNALDLTLAYYLGRAVGRDPEANFYVVSNDGDFDPMIRHLVKQGVKVARVKTIAALPFLPKAKKTILLKKTAPAKQENPAAPAEANAADKRMETLLANLETKPKDRPKKKIGLLAHINTHFGGKLSEAEQEGKLTELVERKVLSVDSDGKVVYR